MPSPVQSILRASSRKEGEKLNILTFPTHERYESNLCRTGHNFYSVAVAQHTKPGWDTDYAAIPENYTILEDINNIPLLLDIDVVLSQNKYGQFELAEEVANRYHCPLVSLEHTCPPSSELSPDLGTEGPQRIYKIPDGVLQSFYQKKGQINVFISEWSRSEWGWGAEEADVVHHGIDTDVFMKINPVEERDNDAISVVNDWVSRDWCCGYTLWESVVSKSGTPVKVVGKNPGLSEPAKNVYDLSSKYNSSRIFLNTSIASPIPTTLLEAMSCGCVVVSTATGMIPEIVKHGYNGLISNNANEIAGYLSDIRNDLGLAKELSENAIKTIKENFSLGTFVDKWNEIFLQAENIGEQAK
tara:strand:+ start:905 stop:1975 length:1071 start_codon:yes stop_codon:yes gene_type:complete